MIVKPMRRIRQNSHPTQNASILTRARLWKDHPMPGLRRESRCREPVKLRSPRFRILSGFPVW